MKNGIVLFLGALRHGEFESLIRRNIPCGALLDTNTKLHLPDLAQFQVVERFDFLKPEAELLRKLRELEAKWGLRCLLNVVGHYVAVFARLAPELGVPGISLHAAQLCLDKSAMGRRFVERIGPQSEATAFHGVAVAGVAAKEGIEKTGLYFMRNPWPSIGNARFSLRSNAAKSQSYLPLGMVVFHGIVGEVQQQLPQKQRAVEKNLPRESRGL